MAMTDKRAPVLSAADPLRPTGGARSLSQPVLSSVEEELDLDTPAHDTGASYTGTQAQGTAEEARQPDWWARTQAQLGRYVSDQPGKAALVALGAGAVAALLLGRGLRGGRRRS